MIWGESGPFGSKMAFQKLLKSTIVFYTCFVFNTYFTVLNVLNDRMTHLWLYTCVGACICVCICVRAEVRMLGFVHACIYLCVCVHVRVRVHVLLRTYVCVCLCIFTHRFACMYVHACRGACQHICVSEEYACAVSVPASSPPGKLQWGCLACPAHTQTLVLLVLLLLNPLLSNHWLLEACEGFPSMRDGLNANTIVINCLWIFVVSKASGRSLSTTHSDRIYTYFYGKPYIYVL